MFSLTVKFVFSSSISSVSRRHLIVQIHLLSHTVNYFLRSSSSLPYIYINTHHSFSQMRLISLHHMTIPTQIVPLTFTDFYIMKSIIFVLTSRPLLELMVKSMAEYLEWSGASEAPRKARFPEQFTDDLTTLVNNLTAEIISRSVKGKCD